MNRYAQIDSNNICFAVTDLSGVVEKPNLIPTSRQDVLGMKWTGSGWITPDPARPEPITTMTHLSFLRRFTAAERSALRAAAKTDPILDDAMYLFEQAKEIDTTDVDTQQFTGYMIQEGLLAPERQAEVLAPVNQDELDAWDDLYGEPEPEP